MVSRVPLLVPQIGQAPRARAIETRPPGRASVSYELKPIMKKK